MANNGNGNQHHHPLIGQHPHIHAFDLEFNHPPRLVYFPSDQTIAHFFTKENRSLQLHSPQPIIPENERHLVNDFRLWVFNEVVLQSVDEEWLDEYRNAYMVMVYFERFLSLHWNLGMRSDEAITHLGFTCLETVKSLEEETLGNYPYMDVNEDRENEINGYDHMLSGAMGVGWRMNLVTPFNFMSFFLRKFQSFPTGNVASTTAAFIYTAMKVNGTLKFRPSVMAAAAALAAMNRNFSRAAVEKKINESRVSEFGLIATAEEVYRCYTTIIELDPYQELVFPAPED